MHQRLCKTCANQNFKAKTLVEQPKGKQNHGFGLHAIVPGKLLLLATTNDAADCLDLNPRPFLEFDCRHIS